MTSHQVTVEDFKDFTPTVRICSHANGSEDINKSIDVVIDIYTETCIFKVTDHHKVILRSGNITSAIKAYNNI